MEQVLTESEDLTFLEHGRKAAGKRNAVETQPYIKFHNELLFLFSDKEGQPATI